MKRIKNLLRFLTLLAVLPAGAASLQDGPDSRPLVRQMFGLRSARELSPSRIEAVLGLAAGPAAGEAEAYRIVSSDDPRYAHARLVRPVRAKVRRETEQPGVPGGPFPVYERTVVELDLPEPLDPGARYALIAQGANRDMVSATTAGTPILPADSPLTWDDDTVRAVHGLRRIELIGPGLLLAEFGPDFQPAALSQPGACIVKISGKPAKIKAFGRITRVDAYIPRGWPFLAIPAHEIFLQVEPGFGEGENVAVEFSTNVTRAARTANFTFKVHESLCNSIKVNQCGYLTDSTVKIAYLGRWLGSFPEQAIGGDGEAKSSDGGEAFWSALKGEAAPAGPGSKESAGPALSYPEAPSFTIHEAATGKQVFTGTSRLVHKSGDMKEGVFSVDHSGENVHVLDFTAFKQPGRYFISVPGTGRSLEFGISDDAYRIPFSTAAHGVFIQRCGIELGPPWTPWRRPACHTNGITPTTMLHHDGRPLKDLAASVDFSLRPDSKPDPAFDQLNADIDLVAHWKLDGKLIDATGNSATLSSTKGTAAPFTADPDLFGDANSVYGPMSEGDGLEAGHVLPEDWSKGFTLAGWFNNSGPHTVDGVLFGFGNTTWNEPKAVINIMGGFVSACVGRDDRGTRYQRMEPNTWNHIALVVPPGTNVEYVIYVNGRPVRRGQARPGQITPTYRAGAFSKDGAGQKLDDLRVYGRCLTDTEVETLARPRGREALKLQALGGHHDAGDYNPRSHLEVAQSLMDTYEIAPRKFFDGQLNIPENTNGIPDLLDEAAWSLRLWAGLQDEDGGVRNGTESNGDPNFIQTVDLDPLGDFAFAKDVAGSLLFAGAFAQAARIWNSLGHEPEAADLLQRARRAYEWADQQPVPQGLSPESHAAQWLTPRAYAAAQLLNTTGEARFNKDFLETAVWARKSDADLAVYKLYDQHLPAWAYMKCATNLVDGAVQAAVRNAILREADLFIQHSSTMAYGFVRHPWAPVTWGTGAYENWLPSTVWAWKLTGEARYLEWIIRTCDNTLGANPLNRSWITGLGGRCVRAPLHGSRYSDNGEAADGLQVQGPNQRGEGYRVQEVAYPPLREDFALLYTYVDAHFAIAMNEGTVVPQAQTMAVFGLLLPDQP